MNTSQPNRRDALRAGAAGAISIGVPGGSLLTVGALTRYAALRFGMQALVPVGLITVAESSEAEPITIMAVLILGLIAGTSAERSKNLSDSKAWTTRQASWSEDFHDSNGPRSVVKPEYRGMETLPSGLTLDTTRQGRFALIGPGNKDTQARKDLNEEELALINRLGIVLPKTERVIEGGDTHAKELQREAWKAMFGGAEPNKLSYTREFTDMSGQASILVSHHKDSPDAGPAFFIGRKA